jgi:non-specific serine/threonine protein kinase
MRARFLREARTAAGLNHPSICTIYEVGEAEGTPFIAMELIEGQTLDEHMQATDQLSLSETTRLAEQISQGLATAHASGIVHRDLKPGNVMLTADGRVKILDFGLAKPGALLDADGEATMAETITAEMTREGTILGTVAYMSPEQAEGKPVDSRSDVFSFGILLFQMASGQLPFRGDTSTATLAKILEAEPDSLADFRQGLPPDFERIVRRCLQKRPDDRYNDTRDLVAALRDLKATGEAQAVSPSIQSQSRRPTWIWPAVAILVVLVGLLLLRQMFQGGTTSEPQVATISQIPSVAVLPFHNLSADQENEYFSVGMTEEIISKLSRIEGLEVASRSSVAPFKELDRNIQEIGANLGVVYVLDGSVRRAGDRVRISTQLVNTESGRNFGSEDFEGSLDDVFAIQEETALKIAEQLDLQLSQQDQQAVGRRSTDNVLAYDAYLKAEGLMTNWSDFSKINEARALYEKALEIDPDFAEALTGLASVDAQIYRNFDTSEERIARAEKNAARAAELDPRMPQALVTLGEIAAMRYDYHRAAQLMREAIQVEPNEPLTWDYLSWALAYQTPPDGQGAVDAAEKALELLPDFPGAYYHLGRGLLALDKTEKARLAFEKALEMNPDFSAAHMGLAQYHLAVGEYEKAMAELDAEGNKTVLYFYYSALIRAQQEDKKAALEALQAAFDIGFRDFVVLEYTPYLEELREDPEYRQLVQSYRD